MGINLIKTSLYKQVKQNYHTSDIRQHNHHSGRRDRYSVSHRAEKLKMPHLDAEPTWPFLTG